MNEYVFITLPLVITILILMFLEIKKMRRYVSVLGVCFIVAYFYFDSSFKYDNFSYKYSWVFSGLMLMIYSNRGVKPKSKKQTE